MLSVSLWFQLDRLGCHPCISLRKHVLSLRGPELRTGLDSDLLVIHDPEAETNPKEIQDHLSRDDEASSSNSADALDCWVPAGTFVLGPPSHLSRSSLPSRLCTHAFKDADVAKLLKAIGRIETNQKQQGAQPAKLTDNFATMNRMVGAVVERQAYREVGPLLARVIPELGNVKVSTFQVSWPDASFWSLAIQFQRGNVNIHPLPDLTWKGSTGKLSRETSRSTWPLTPC